MPTKCSSCGEPQDELVGAFYEYEFLCDRCAQNKKDALTLRIREYEKELAEARFKWPKACLNCLGAGGFDHYTPGSVDSPPEYDRSDCEDCIAKQICPRCGSKFGYGGEDFFDGGCSTSDCFFASADMKPVLPRRPE